VAELLHVDPERLKGRHVSRAVEGLRRGGILIYPTDTIYGLGCDITAKGAIDRIRLIKGREVKKPMSIICSGLTDISRYARVSNFAHRVLKRCLPGPYTFVLPAAKVTPRILQSKQKTVGIRVPDHPVPMALVNELGNPIVTTSANRSGWDVLTDPLELESELGHQVDMIMECGQLPVLPSSVISLVGDEVEILREGEGDLSLFREQS
jgi:tRNA threonylcarbamoyl adenosine modification protein (Sua5/YciO/YrdC/YwlC family)